MPWAYKSGCHIQIPFWTDLPMHPQKLFFSSAYTKPPHSQEGVVPHVATMCKQQADGFVYDWYKKNVLVMEKWTMDQLSFFFLEKKIGPGIWREMQLKHAWILDFGRLKYIIKLVFECKFSQGVFYGVRLCGLPMLLVLWAPWIRYLLTVLVSDKGRSVRGNWISRVDAYRIFFIEYCLEIKHMKLAIRDTKRHIKDAPDWPNNYVYNQINWCLQLHTIVKLKLVLNEIHITVK